MHVGELREAARIRLEPAVDCGAESVPARQHQPALSPAEYPGNRPQVFDARRRGSRRRTAADVELGDLGDRRRRAEVFGKLGGLVHERAIGTVGACREVVEDREIRRCAPAEALGVLEARFERRGDQRFQVAPSELRVGILAGDDLALLGDPKPSGHAARRLREDRIEARPAAAADRAAAAVKEPQLHAVRAAGVDEQHFSAIQRPVGRQVAAVLVAVRVAEHHFLPVAAAGDHRSVGRHRESRTHDVAAARKVVDRLEQRNDVDGERRAAQQPGFLQQDRDLEQVGDRLAFRDHVVRQRRRAEARVNVGGLSKDRKLAHHARRIVEMR